MGKVAILLGSKSDLVTIEHSKDYYDYFGIEYEIHIYPLIEIQTNYINFLVKQEKMDFLYS